MAASSTASGDGMSHLSGLVPTRRIGRTRVFSQLVTSNLMEERSAVPHCALVEQEAG